MVWFMIDSLHCDSLSVCSPSVCPLLNEVCSIVLIAKHGDRRYNEKVNCGDMPNLTIWQKMH